MKLSIIIPHYKTPDILRVCLNALKKEINLPELISYEIIVSDGETDKNIIAELTREYPEVLFVENNKNVGFAKLVNAGLKKARGKFIFVINADIIVKNGQDIIRMVEYLEKNGDVGIIAPRLLNPDGSVQQTYFRNYTFFTVVSRRTFFGRTKLGVKILDRFNYKDMKIAGIFEPDWILGAAFLIKKDRLDKIGGGLDERFFMYFEDVDLCRRFKEAGLRVVYYPLSGFTHQHARASDRGRGVWDIFVNYLTRIHIVSYLKYLWKWNIEKYLI